MPGEASSFLSKPQGEYLVWLLRLRDLGLFVSESPGPSGTVAGGDLGPDDHVGEAVTRGPEVKGPFSIVHLFVIPFGTESFLPHVFHLTQINAAVPILQVRKRGLAGVVIWHPVLSPALFHTGRHHNLQGS